MTQLIHPELSYQVRGVLLDVYNKRGPMLKEEYYEAAIAIGLEQHHIRCDTQKSFEVYYEGARVGLYYVDIWIEDGKILLELKVSPAIEPIHQAQALSYLKVTNADLAIVVNYGGASLEDQRLPNFVRQKGVEFAWESASGTQSWLYPDLTNVVLRACHRVYFVLGPGFLHQVYRRATMIELQRSGIAFEYVKQIPIEYGGHLLGHQDTRLILVEDKVLLATVALRENDEPVAQLLRARLRQFDLSLGILANFYGTKLAITPVRVK